MMKINHFSKFILENIYFHSSLTSRADSILQTKEVLSCSSDWKSNCIFMAHLLSVSQVKKMWTIFLSFHWNSNFKQNVSEDFQ